MSKTICLVLVLVVSAGKTSFSFPIENSCPFDDRSRIVEFSVGALSGRSGFFPAAGIWAPPSQARAVVQPLIATSSFSKAGFKSRRVVLGWGAQALAATGALVVVGALPVFAGSPSRLSDFGPKDPKLQKWLERSFLDAIRNVWVNADKLSWDEIRIWANKWVQDGLIEIPFELSQKRLNSSDDLMETLLMEINQKYLIDQGYAILPINGQLRFVSITERLEDNTPEGRVVNLFLVRAIDRGPEFGGGTNSLGIFMTDRVPYYSKRFAQSETLSRMIPGRGLQSGGAEKLLQELEARVLYYFIPTPAHQDRRIEYMIQQDFLEEKAHFDFLARFREYNEGKSLYSFSGTALGVAVRKTLTPQSELGRMLVQLNDPDRVISASSVILELEARLRILCLSQSPVQSLIDYLRYPRDDPGIHPYAARLLVNFISRDLFPLQVGRPAGAADPSLEEWAVFLDDSLQDPSSLERFNNQLRGVAKKLYAREFLEPNLGARISSIKRPGWISAFLRSNLLPIALIMMATPGASQFPVYADFADSGLERYLTRSVSGNFLSRYGEPHRPVVRSLRKSS